MTKTDLAAIEKRLAAVPEGPWQRSKFVMQSRHIYMTDAERENAALRERRIIRGPGTVGDSACNPVFGVDFPVSEELLDFLAHSVDDVKQLLAEVRRSRSIRSSREHMSW